MSAVSVKMFEFHGDRLETFEFEGQPWVAARSVVSALNMNWTTQQSKLLSQKEKFGCRPLKGIADSLGRMQKMLAIPVAKLPLWLASINPNKIKDAATRRKVELYQAESAIALHDYWFKGAAVKPDAGTGIGVDPRMKDAIREITREVIAETVPSIVSEILTQTVPVIIKETLAEVVPALVRSELASHHADHAQDRFDTARYEALKKDEKRLRNQIGFREKRREEDWELLEELRPQLDLVERELAGFPALQASGNGSAPMIRDAHSDCVERFVQEAVIGYDDPSCRTSPLAFYNHYCDYCRIRAIPAVMEGVFHKRLPGALAAKGIRVSKTDNGAITYEGCGILQAKIANGDAVISHPLSEKFAESKGRR